MNIKLKAISKTAICLLLGIVLSLNFCVIASANTVNSADVVENENAIFSERKFLSSSSADVEKAKKIIANGLLNTEESIDISECNIPVADLFDIYCEALYSVPQAFHAKTECSYTYGTLNPTITKKVKPVYIFDKQTYESKKLQFDSIINDIVINITSDYSEAEKALLVHDALILHNKYDVRLFDANSSVPNTSYSAYGAISLGVSVCQGYSLAYKYMMDKLGIECHIVTSNKMQHMWNMVKIDGSYYHVDTTFDDELLIANNTKIDQTGYVGHKNFLANDAEITATGHSDWMAPYKSTSTALSKSFIKELNNSATFGIEGDLYYINSSAQLIKQKSNGGQQSVIYTFDDEEKWNESDKSFYYWNTTYARLANANDGCLYFNVCKEIKSIDLATLKTKVVSDLKLANEEHTSGLKATNGNFYYDKKHFNKTFTQNIAFTLIDDNYNPNGPVAVGSYGDANADSKINMADVLVLRKYLAKWNVTLNLENADCNADTKINMADVLLLRKYLAKWSVTLGPKA